MDPLLIAALGAGLVTALTKLLEKGVVDPALDKGLEPLREWLTGGYNKKKDEARLRQAVEAALKETTGVPNADDWAGYRWVLALDSIKANPNLAARVAAATLEMPGDDPARVPPDLLQELKIENERAAFAAFLFKLRKNLSGLPPYSEGIRYAEALHARGRLDGLYELVAGVVVERDGQKFVRVHLVPPDARALEEPYLKNARHEFAGLFLEGRSKDDTLSPDKPLRLERVYIALDTTETRQPPPDLRSPSPVPRGRAGVGVSALRAAMESRRLVLLGDPGSGKSTFAQHLCLCLAGARLDPQGEWPGYLRAADAEGWELAFYPFPLLIRLRLFAHDADCLPDDPKQMGRAEHLLKFIQKEAVRLGRPELAGRVLELLENGDALVVLDGLDEVTHPNPARADADRRRAVAQAIGHFAHTRFPHARLLVTCREKQYPLNAEGEPAAPWKLPGFPVVKLADFDPEQIESFVAQWFDELQARGRVKDAAADRDSLLTALTARRELSDLAPKPILLTQMALVHNQWC